jgi:hypothetical protein
MLPPQTAALAKNFVDDTGSACCDLSINIKNSEKIFAELRKVIEAGVADESLRKQLLEHSAEMEGSVGEPTFFKKYSDFIALGANHMQLLAPFIPALTQLAQ